VLSRNTGQRAAVNVADARELRSTLGSFATGVTIATTMDAELGPVGVTANSFSSVSIDPPLVSWCLKQGSYSLPAFRRSQRFAINVLGASHIELCRRFAQSHSQKWDGINYRAGSSGCPNLVEAIAIFECRIVAEHEAGDHVILLGQIEMAHADTSAEPLVFYRGAYTTLEKKQDNREN
jgi:flavin reductase (DIM6/NTAB) family NADH-FMN oxidoreductase RutF